MAVEIEVRGGDEFKTLASSLQRVAGDIPPAAREGIRRGVRGIEADVRASLGGGLPHRGGLADRMGQTRLVVSPVSEGVRITADAPYNLAGIDAGAVVHPLYGNRGHWFSQTVPAGLFTKPIQDDADKIARSVRASVDDAIRL